MFITWQANSVSSWFFNLLLWSLDFNPWQNITFQLQCSHYPFDDCKLAHCEIHHIPNPCFKFQTHPARQKSSSLLLWLLRFSLLPTVWCQYLHECIECRDFNPCFSSFEPRVCSFARLFNLIAGFCFIVDTVQEYLWNTSPFTSHRESFTDCLFRLCFLSF